MTLTRTEVVDSHTGGEPTRMVVSGGPELGSGTVAERRERFRLEHDAFRSAVVNEPRGSDEVVGALLVPPDDPAAITGVIFFNNVGYLNMCVHGTIGVIVTLAHMGRIRPGTHRLDTPVGPVTATLHLDGEVEVRNVQSYRFAQGISVDVPGYGTVRGDVAWGGNWFFLVDEHDEVLELSNVERLTDVTWRIRQALERDGTRGADGGEIDHIELFGPSPNPHADSRNFVLCPGKAYDRSPCGTGTSAKLACLHADGKLAPGAVWRQESIVGSIFRGRVEVKDGKVYPLVRGSAFVTSESTLLFDSSDPFRDGIR
ncbi:MAG: 4-hydroxyproline epimerase [Candidatus Eisenbacteria bacterium]|uniref:4-hydroxyproline epimerase n=1 Tax=Eiseniibacteriota bacterium TaxID=2212470 RepID=A0A956NGF9_UNCEI|nr:4-hydroxyproline epimerase [Candidatus Eisenbacteria bacterium]MCB9463668.1 4-hydroxyproline epimerase [Candidatus Eisenbacteria bacterium]